MVRRPKRSSRGTRPNRIRELRVAREWSQGDLGERIHRDQRTVSAHERGATAINAEDLQCYAEVFGVSVDEVLGRSDAPSHAPASPLARSTIPAPPGDTDDAWERQEAQYLRAEVSKALDILRDLSNALIDGRFHRVGEAPGRKTASHSGGDGGATKDQQKDA